MPVQTMYDFLSDLTADYTTAEMTVDPQDVMLIGGEKDIIPNQGLGVTSEQIILSTQSRFSVKLQWKYLSEADHSTLFSFYHDSTKGCGTARTFYWHPPAQYDAHVYTVRFASKWESFLQNYQNYGIANLVLAVVGRKAEA